MRKSNKWNKLWKCYGSLRHVIYIYIYILFIFIQLEEIIEDGINNQEKIIEAVSSTLAVMKNLTSSSTEMSAGDLSSSMDILEKIVDVTDTTTGPIIEKEVDI